MPLVLKVATRGSVLARWQTQHVGDLLNLESARFGADVVFEPVIVQTTADQRLDIPISELGGKGVFVKEVQSEVLGGRARLAVHSGKDLPAITHPDLFVGAVPERADPRDVLVGATLGELSSGALIATGSVRRRAQLAWLRPDLVFTELRGNIATRIEKIPPGGAILMAAAALDRLGLYEHLSSKGIEFEILEPTIMLPQVAQGSLAIECRADDDEALELLSRIDHRASRISFEAERSFLATLGGDCNLPAGAYATLNPGSGSNGERCLIEGLLASPNGHMVLRMCREGTADEAVELGRVTAVGLLEDAGGADLLFT